MKESRLYEELLKIDEGNLDIALKNTPPRIRIIGKGDIDKVAMWQILKLVDKNKANLRLLSYGVLEITF